MSTEKEKISIVWFKRDLRLNDNEAIYNALQTKNKVVFLYVFERLLLEDSHYSERHWNFVKESIRDLNIKLKKYNTKVLTVHSDIISACNTIQNKYDIQCVFSHQETGILITYERDKAFKRYCKNNRIDWRENINNGVIRGLLNRDNWFENWNDYMNSNLIPFNPDNNQFLNILELKELEQLFYVPPLTTSPKSKFQKGGSTMAWNYASSFFKDRHHSYMQDISKPHKAFKSCSRLSPYISWGNVSIRELYYKTKEVKQQSIYKGNLSAFSSRLRWQAHFIQKFEMEHIMEKESINKGYHVLKKNISKKYQHAWKTGMTGFPLIDASMRCLNETGYINFRMRAMLVSFFTHILWQPWQDASKHLSRMFLDFEPGIHFPQLQMQAGETGINNLRIYNPIKNSKEHDSEAEFIKKWVPELKDLETGLIHEPYLLTELEKKMYNIRLGTDYPFPIVDLNTNRKQASNILWGLKKNKYVEVENERILKKHTIKNRKRMINSD